MELRSFHAWGVALLCSANLSTSESTHKRSFVFISILALTACGPEASTSNQSGTPIDYPIDLESLYVPSGRMGDAEAGEPYVSFHRDYRGLRRPGDHDGFVTRVSYSGGPVGWAGVYWQWPDGNWGENPGRSLSARRVAFHARGETGGELVEFKVGGIGSDGAQTFRDSVDRSSGGVRLEPEWKRYEIELSDQDLSSVIGGFAWIVQARANSDHVVFYIDNVRFE
jgi:hypothetical protein